MTEATLHVTNALITILATQMESQYMHVSVCKQVTDMSFQNEGEQYLQYFNVT